MNDLFNEFISNITLTPSQQEDALRKYTGVCEKLYHAYYGEGTYDSSKQYLFGSYKTKTNIRPLTESQDVDVLFKIPQSTFNKYDAYTSNGQAALLQEVKNILKEKYTTTDKIKAWGKVVLVQFAENHHNVELLPALEKRMVLLSYLIRKRVVHGSFLTQGQKWTNSTIPIKRLKGLHVL